MKDEVKTKKQLVSELQDLRKQLSEKIESIEQLREDGEAFLLSFKHSPVALAIATAKEGVFLDVNVEFVNLTEFSREEIIGHTANELGLWVHPEQRGEFAERIRKDGVLRSCSALLRAKSGKICDLIWSGGIVKFRKEACLLSSAVDVTARTLVEEKLRQYSEEISDLYHNAPCGYHSLDGDGVFCNINATELKWLGYARDEIVGKKKWSDLVTEEGVEIFKRNFPVFKKQGWINDLEFNLIRKDGTIMTVLLSATAIRDAKGNFVRSRSTLFDITVRKRIEEAFKEANRLIETVIAACPLAVIAIDNDDIVKVWNPAAESIFGWNREEIIGRPLPIVPEDRRAEFERIRDIIKHKKVNEHIRIRRKKKDGSIIDADLSIFPLVDSRGEVTGRMGIYSKLNEAVAKRQKFAAFKEDYIRREFNAFAGTGQKR